MKPEPDVLFVDMKRRCATCIATVVMAVGLLPFSWSRAEFALDKTNYAPDEPIRASWSDAPGNPTDWIGIYSNPGNGPVDGTFVGGSTIWFYTNGTQAAGVDGFPDGAVTFGTPGLGPGAYIAFFLEADGYSSIEDPVEFLVDANDGIAPEMHADPIRLVPAEVGQEYRGRLGPYAKGGGTLAFSKVGAGAAWLTVEENGDLTGTPVAAELGTQSFRVRVTNDENLSVEADVTVDVTPPGGIPVNTLSVMTYNLWVGGTPAKNLEAIIKSGADVIGLQETNGVRAREHADALGWFYAQSGGSTGVLSRYPIVDTQFVGSGTGTRVQVSADPQQEIVLWSCHLTAFPYGPYDACFDDESVDVLLDRETSSGRLPQVQRILDAMAGAIATAETTPVFLVGDFNTPSHLDWTAATAANHCGYTVSWPVTAAVSDAGLTDTFRVAHPDPVAMPGTTWSPIYSLRDSVGPDEEPQDRIDMIHFGGDGVSVDSAEVFILPGTLEDVPNHGGNAWPSDHASVVSTLTLPVPQGERLGHAFAPEPTLNKSGVIITDLNLQWRGDIGADSYDVYLGTDAVLGAGSFRSNVTNPIFSPGELDGGTTYFWRVDTLKAGGEKIAGKVWSFSTASVLGGSGRWNFDEGSGTTAADSGGGGIHGALVELDEDAWIETSILGNGIEFTFDNGWVEFGEEPALRPTAALTVAAWINPAVFVDYSGVAGYVHDTGNVESGYSLHTRSNDRFGWGVGTEDRGSILYLTSTESYDPDQWYYVVGTYDGSELKLFVNGVEASSAALTGPIDYDPLPEAGFVIGTYLDDNDDIRFEGKLTQIEFWPRALTGSEIRSIFSETGTAVCPSNFLCTENVATGEVTLSWSPPDNVEASGFELLRDGQSIATLALDATGFSDTPPNAAAAGLVEVVYTLRLMNPTDDTCPPLTCTASFFNGSLSDELVLYLSFDDSIEDESGNDTGTDVQGSPTTVDGAIGGAFAFDDTADPRQYVILEDTEALQFGEATDFSVSFWVQSDNPMTDNRDNGGTNFDPAMISNKDWNSGGNPGWVISANSSNAQSNGEGHLEWNFSDGSSRVDFDTTDALINDGDWHHVLVSHDRDDVAAFYLDGRSLGEVDISGIGDINSDLTTNIATDGAEGGTWENWFPGAIDDLAIWRRVVSPEEVATIHTAGTTGGSAIGGADGSFAVTTVTFRATEKEVALSWRAGGSKTYAIEMSENLANWTELEDGVEGGGDNMATFTDTNIPVGTRVRYYRIIER